MNKYSLLLIFVLSFLVINSVSAVDLEQKGKGTFNGNVCDKMGDKDKQATIELAKKNAWAAYTAGFDLSRMSQYKKMEKDFTDKLDDFLTDVSVLDNLSDKTMNSCDILVKVKINEAAVDAKFKASSAIGSVESGEGSTISFIFVGRQITSSKAFKDREVSMDSVKETVNTKKSEKGGSVEKKTAKEKYEVIATTDFDASFNEVLTGNGFEVTDYDDVYNNCGGETSKNIKAEFVKSDEMSAPSRKKAIDAAKKCDVRYFATGLMNVSVPDMDATTGNLTVWVNINGMVWDIAKKLPKKIGSVGGTPYKGLGPDQNTARRNALKEAATDVAKKIVSMLNSKNIK